MISGSELRDARVRADLTQEQLALRLDMTQRSVGDWERGKGVPRNREAKVRDVLGHHLTGHPDPGDPLGSVSDVAQSSGIGHGLVTYSTGVAYST